MKRKIGFIFILFLFVFPGLPQGIAMAHPYAYHSSHHHHHRHYRHHHSAYHTHYHCHWLHGHRYCHTHRHIRGGHHR